MARLFVQRLGIYNIENWPEWQKIIAKVCQSLKNANTKLANAFKILPKWRNFAKSGHTDCDCVWQKVKKNSSSDFMLLINRA